jgi:hypothetical protein
LALAKQHPVNLIKNKSENAGRPTKTSLGTIMKIKKKVRRNPSIGAKS